MTNDHGMGAEWRKQHDAIRARLEADNLCKVLAWWDERPAIYILQAPDGFDARVEDTSIGTFQTKEEAVRAIVDWCLSHSTII